MRRLWLLLLLGLIPACLFAQESGGAAEPERPMVWMWANFLILAGGLGYLISKTGGAFYRSRAQAIEKGIAEAALLRREAEEMATGIERKLASLADEIARMKATAKAEFSSEGRRIGHESTEIAGRILHQAEQEISAASKHAIQELKAFAAKLALDLAERQVRAGMTPEMDRRLIDTFAHELGAGNASGEAA